MLVMKRAYFKACIANLRPERVEYLSQSVLKADAMTT